MVRKIIGTAPTTTRASRARRQGARVTDPQLTRDPINWALAQLGDLRGLANRAAAPDLAAASDDLQSQVDAVQDEIRVALQKCASASPA